MKKQVEKWNVKQIVFVLCMMVMGSRLVGQTILFDVKTYNSGYNVSCHGYTDGSVQVTVVEGTYPFTYSWNTGATTPNLNNVGAGFYTLTVTDANAVVVSKTVELKEPDGFDAVLHPSQVQGGYNISAMGGHDGKIATEITGGTPPYTYAWSNNATSSYIDNLGAGIYTVTINDQNTCAVTRTQVLTAPSLLHIVSITASNQNGHSVSCFGKANGSITTVVSGGVPPYTYAWDNGSFDANPSNLKAGIYKLSVMDANNSKANGQITLTEPTELALTLTRSNFGGYTISCNSCANGTINTSVAGGTSPFTYLWDGGQTNANRHNLGVGSYSVTVTDANGCQTTGNAAMTEPANAGWDFAGNAVGANDAIGTSNNQPLVFKTNSTEKMRVAENGNIGIGTNNPIEKMDVNGNINLTGGFKWPGGGHLGFSHDAVDHYILGPQMFWIDPCLSPTVSTLDFPGVFRSGQSTSGQSIFMSMGYDGANGIIDMAGTRSDGTNPGVLINYYCGKNVAICTGPNGGYVSTGKNFEVGGPDRDAAIAVNVKSSDQTSLYVNAIHTSDNGYGAKLAVNRAKTKAIAVANTSDNTENFVVFGDGFVFARDVKVTLSAFAHPDFVFEKNYKLMKLAELEKYLKTNKHLPNVPSAKEVKENDGISLGEMSELQLKKIEELTLYIIELNKRIEDLEKLNVKK